MTIVRAIAALAALVGVDGLVRGML